MADELFGFEPHQRERIVDVIDRRLDQCIDTLADQAGIGTEHQHDRSRRIGSSEEFLDVGGFESDHCASPEASWPGLSAIPTYLHRIACAIGMRGSSAAHDGRETQCDLGAGNEIRGKPVADHIGCPLDGAIFGIAARALAGKALLRARNVIVDVDVADSLSTILPVASSTS